MIAAPQPVLEGRCSLDLAYTRDLLNSYKATMCYLIREDHGIQNGCKAILFCVFLFPTTYNVRQHGGSIVIPLKPEGMNAHVEANSVG